MLKGSRPDSRSAGSGVAGTRGVAEAAPFAISAMCSGVVPQQPPRMFTRPASANSPTTSPMVTGDWSYSPKAFGRPALG